MQKWATPPSIHAVNEYTLYHAVKESNIPYKLCKFKPNIKRTPKKCQHLPGSKYRI